MVPAAFEGATTKEAEIENVRVAIRIRPLSMKEESQGSQNIALLNDKEKVLALNNPKVPQTQCKSFKFDHIFPEDCTQMDLYQKVALPIVDQVFKGYNGTIFAYGQTGSGKTYTMSGNQNRNESKGIIPNTFSHIFSQISRASEETSFVVTSTYIEIYNEEIRDLLSIRPNEKLELRERVGIGVYIKGLTGFTVDSIESITALMNVGNMNRTTRATLMNNLSSRSHAIFTIMVEAMDRENNKTTVAKLNLVDLAGSERLKRSQATGIGLKEASNINQSLFVLSNVISALVEEKCSHIPYRNSKLTRLLQDSLGGNSKTAMIATISPGSYDYDESLCTLRYASRAKLIKNRIHLNLQTDKGLIENFEQEIALLKEQLGNILSKEEIQIHKVKRKRIQSSKSLSEEKRKAQKEEILTIEKIKQDLDAKISTIQNKILIGGQNLLDRAQEQQFLLESTIEEMHNLDMSRVELEEHLKETSFACVDLREQFPSLRDVNSTCDKELETLVEELNETQRQLEDEKHEHGYELRLLEEHKFNSLREMQLSNCVIKVCVPNYQLKKVESNIAWNADICDFQISGVAHVGNNMNTDNIPKRRFKRHIPKSGLMGFLCHERKNSLRENVEAEVPRPKTKNLYLQYGKPIKKEDD